MKRFPVGRYGRQILEFHPAPFKAPIRAFAVLVFPWKDDLVLVCDIEGRGWCIPSGRVEPGESSAEAALREALEEGGAVLCNVQYIGCYKISERSEVRWADCYASRIGDLVEIGIAAESRGRQLVGIEQLPDLYHLWNDLTRNVFEHSLEILQRAELRSQ